MHWPCLGLMGTLRAFIRGKLFARFANAIPVACRTQILRTAHASDCNPTEAHSKGIAHS